MKKDMPPLIRMAQNLGKSIFKNVDSVLSGNDLTVSEGSFEMRLNICRFCSLYSSDDVRCSHPECGCFLNVKAKLYAEDCPLHKWLPVIPENYTGE